MPYKATTFVEKDKVYNMQYSSKNNSPTFVVQRSAHRVVGSRAFIKYLAVQSQFN
jgi:hypothetical protein